MLTGTNVFITTIQTAQCHKFDIITISTFNHGQHLENKIYCYQIFMLFFHFPIIPFFQFPIIPLHICDESICHMSCTTTYSTSLILCIHHRDQPHSNASLFPLFPNLYHFHLIMAYSPAITPQSPSYYSPKSLILLPKVPHRHQLIGIQYLKH